MILVFIIYLWFYDFNLCEVIVYVKNTYIVYSCVCFLFFLFFFFLEISKILDLILCTKFVFLPKKK